VFADNLWITNFSISVECCGMAKRDEQQDWDGRAQPHTMPNAPVTPLSSTATARVRFSNFPMRVTGNPLPIRIILVVSVE